MQINRGLRIFIRPLVIIILSISLGIVYMVSATKDIAVAETDETMSATNYNDLDVIIIDKDDYERDRKGPVRFEHKAHASEYNVSCWDCHHEYDDGENIWSPWGTTLACSDCHDASIKMDEIIKLQTAFHNNCKKCHKEQAIYGDDAQAYRKCNTCHMKAE